MTRNIGNVKFTNKGNNAGKGTKGNVGGRLTGKAPLVSRIFQAQGRALFAGFAIAAILLPVAAVVVVKLAVLGGGLATFVASIRD